MNEEETKSETKRSGVSRREFIAGTVGGVVVGAVVGAAAGSLGFPKTVTQIQTQTQTVTSVSTTTASAVPSKWDLTADVVVIGSGAAGLPAAIAAKDAGASVVIVEANYDVGGHAMLAGGHIDQMGPADQVFASLTAPATPYQDRQLSRTYADMCPPLFTWLLANGLVASSNGTTYTPCTTLPATMQSIYPYYEGLVAFGTNIYPQDIEHPGGAGDTALVRVLEASARTKGVQFLLNTKMTSIIRQQQYSGNVLGITAVATGGRIMPGSTTALQPWKTSGNITVTGTTINIRANKAVIIADGGHSSNVMRRREMDPRLTAMYPAAGEPYSFQNGDGEYAARRIGAALYATNNTADYGSAITKPGHLGCYYQYGNLYYIPSSPMFPLAVAQGLALSDVTDVIHVNMAGARFIAENTSGTAWTDAALAINSASVAPDYAAGPVWAIFDSAAVTREKWTLGAPYTDPAWFFQANDLPTLATQINTNKYMATPMSGATLQATVTKFNGFVDAGKDADFGRPVANLKYKINTPPYYAAVYNVVPHDCLTGIRMDTGAHVLDLDGNVIPHLYVAGESAGGFSVHGLTKCMVFGLIAGQNGAKETST